MTAKLRYCVCWIVRSGGPDPFLGKRATANARTERYNRPLVTKTRIYHEYVTAGSLTRRVEGSGRKHWGGRPQGELTFATLT